MNQYFISISLQKKKSYKKTYGYNFPKFSGVYVGLTRAITKQAPVEECWVWPKPDPRDDWVSLTPDKNLAGYDWIWQCAKLMCVRSDASQTQP